MREGLWEGSTLMADITHETYKKLVEEVSVANLLGCRPSGAVMKRITDYFLLKFGLFNMI